MLGRIAFVVVVAWCVSATVAQQAPPVWANRIASYPRKHDQKIVDVSTDGKQFLMIRQKDKKVQQRGTIDSLHLCDVASGEEVKTIIPPPDEVENEGDWQREQIDVAALSPDGKFVVTGGWGGHVRAVEVESGKLIHEWKESFRHIEHLAISRDSKRIAAARYDDSTRRTVIDVYDVSTHEKLAVLNGHEDSIGALQFLSDGRLISGSNDELIHLWDLKTAPASPKGTLPPAHTLKGHSAMVRSISVSPDEKRAVSAGTDGRICQWDLTTGRLVRRFSPCAKDPFDRSYVNVVEFLQDGKQYLSRGSDHLLTLWDFETGQMLDQERGGSDSIFALPDGQHMIVGLQYWAVPGGYLPTPNAPTLPNEATTLIPSKMYGPIAGALYGIRVANITGQQLSLITTEGYSDHFTRVDLLTGKMDEPLVLKKAADGKGDPLDFSPDGKFLARGDMHGNLFISDANSREAIKTFPAQRGIYKAIWSPDGKTLIASETPRQDDGNKADICVWDVESTKLIHRLEGSIGLIWAMAISSDGKTLISGSGMTGSGRNDLNCDLRVWDLQNGKETQKLTGQQFVIQSVAISPDGKLAASGGRQGPVFIWDLSTGKEKFCLEGSQNRDGNSQTGALAFSPDGACLASGGADSDIRVWNTATGKEIVRLEDHRRAVLWLGWANNDTLISTGVDATAREWNIKEAETAKDEGL